MKRSGRADLPLHYGKVPPWLYERMSKMGLAIVEAITIEYGNAEVIKRLSDPHWFQSLGAVLGMDWHSSGITTSVLGALKRSINPISNELGIYICGGRGKYSRQTPTELNDYALKTGINAEALVQSSRLTAKIDNNALQDGFQLYLHSFIVTNKGEWTVVQQGMDTSNRMARRYHWYSENLNSFINEPHNAVCGENQGLILNLTHNDAELTRNKILSLTKERPDRIVREVQKLVMPNHHDVREKDVDLKKLGSILALAYESDTSDFESLLLTKGLGPKTLRSLTFVSEIIHGTPSRFKDPARFSMAHGGKDGHPYPVQTAVYDDSLKILKESIEKAKIDHSDRLKALKKIHDIAKDIEKKFVPNNQFYEYLEKERKESKFYGGRTVFDNNKRKTNNNTNPRQLNLFD